MKNLAILLCFICSGAFAQDKKDIRDSEESFIVTYHKEYLAQEMGIRLPKNANLMLFDTIDTWLGTPYQYAGNCTKGIDCSGFVTILFNRVYGKNIGARNSADIYQQLEPINKDEIKEGDLVFFGSTKRRISHVGLYLGDSNFVHASSSRGVIISNLDEPYYKKRFAGAGRWMRDIADSNENDK